MFSRILLVLVLVAVCTASLNKVHSQAHESMKVMLKSLRQQGRHTLHRGFKKQQQEASGSSVSVGSESSGSSVSVGSEDSSSISTTSGSGVDCTTEANINLLAAAGAACADVFTAMSNGVESLFSGRFANTSEAVCNAECFTAARALPVECIPQNDAGIQIFAALFPILEVMCSEENGVQCGAVFDVLVGLGACDGPRAADQAECTARNAKCKFQENKKQCDFQYDDETLDAFCSPCLNKFAALFLGKDKSNDDPASGVSQVPFENFQSVMCAKVDNTYCIPLLQDDLSGQDDNGSPFKTDQSVAQFCDGGIKGQCFRRFTVAASKFTVRDSRDAVAQCASQVGNQQAAVARCRACYVQDLKEAASMKFISDKLCTKNSAGKYCMAMLDGTPPIDGIEECVGGLSNGTCDSGCDTKFVQATAHYGCCLGFVQWNLKGYTLTDEDEDLFERAITKGLASGSQGPREGTIPHRRREDEIPEEEVNSEIWEMVGGHNDSSSSEDSTDSSSSGWYPPSPGPQGRDCANNGNGGDFDLRALMYCDSFPQTESGINEFFDQNTCQKAFSALRKTFRLKLKLKCSMLDPANADIVTAVLGRLRADIALNLLLAEDEVQGGSLSCDADSRRQTGNSVVYEFSVQTESDALTNAAESRLGSLLESGSLVLPSTIDYMVSTNCVACTDDVTTLLELDSVVLETPEPEPPTPPIGAATQSLLAAVVAIILCMLM